MRTRILSILLSFVIVLCMGIGVAEARSAIVRPQLLFDGSTAECYVYIRSPGDEIEATMELWEGRTLLDSWSGSGSSVLTLEGSHRATSGHTYTVEIYGTVDGEPLDVTPVSETCP